jgi:hypothetical protein
MIEPNDPFTGTWRFIAKRSKLDTPLPLNWVQEIVATPDELVVRENIVRSNGVKSDVRIWARFDGTDYPISGFPIADTMAYKRLDRHNISGTGKKNGVVALTETITVGEDGTVMTLIYSVQAGASSPVVARGIAVFEKGLTALD